MFKVLLYLRASQLTRALASVATTHVHNPAVCSFQNTLDFQMPPSYWKQTEQEQGRVVLPPTGIGQCLETFIGCHNWKGVVLLASRGQRSGLLNIPQCTGWPPQQRLIWPKAPKLRNLEVKVQAANHLRNKKSSTSHLTPKSASNGLETAM